MQTREQLTDLLRELGRIIDHCIKSEEVFSSEISGVHPSFHESARNLIHYLALRSFDIRNMQQTLAGMGLSSLGRAEGHVLNSLVNVRNHLCRLVECPQEMESGKYTTLSQSNLLLEKNKEELLGLQKEDRKVRIMVTLSGEVADDYPLIRDLVSAGMDCARINCAHDSKEIWIKIIDNISRAKKETGSSCKVLMDLAGLKLRTGPLKPGPRVIRVRPKRDFFGKLLKPARVWLGPPGLPSPEDKDVSIPVNGDWLKSLQPGDKVLFNDKRGKKRQFEIVSCEKGGCLAELFQRSYIESGTTLALKDKKRNLEPAEVGPLPEIEERITLKPGDILLLHKAIAPGEDAKYSEDGLIVEPAHISCSNPGIFSKVRSGERILFDDGKIEGMITSASDDLLVVKITQAKKDGSRLGADKGINLPDSDLGFSGLQEKDLDDLHFVARHADVVNLSFASVPEDIYALQDELAKLNAAHIGVMLKIETEKGFKNLPLLLLAAMKSYPAGVMIARGDLAVECGWQRLAEVQEEILWVCEAAHVPVVWATQVLESLAKKGSPSRAEITDAAMAQRADCVMLNKGPHILQTIKMLSDILARMEAHQHKKTSMLKNLRVTEAFQWKS